MCLYAWGGSTVACDLSVIWLLQRPQEIRQALMEQPRKQLFPDVLWPGGRVGGWYKKHKHKHTQTHPVQWHAFRDCWRTCWCGRAGSGHTRAHTHTDKGSWLWQMWPICVLVIMCCRKTGSEENLANIWHKDHNSSLIFKRAFSIKNTYNSLN